MQIGTRVLTTGVALLVLALIAEPAVARDRPGTPNNVKVYACGIQRLEPPAICAQFNNTAAESVRFDIEATVNGSPAPRGAFQGYGRHWSDVGKANSATVPRQSKVECLNTTSPLSPDEKRYFSQCRQNPSAYTKSECDKRFQIRLAPSHECEAASSLVHGSMPGRGRPGTAGKTWDYVYSKRKSAFLPAYLLGQNKDVIQRRIMPQGFRINDVEPYSTWCFRFRARRVSDQVVSQLWSNWACAKARGLPPKPSRPHPVTAEFLAGEWDGSSDKAVPSRLVVKWGRAQNAGWYTISCRSRSACNTVVDYYTQATMPLEATIRVSKEDVAAHPSVTVCAHNFAGKACTLIPGNIATMVRPRLRRDSSVAVGALKDRGVSPNSPRPSTPPKWRLKPLGKRPLTPTVVPRLRRDSSVAVRGLKGSGALPNSPRPSTPPKWRLKPLGKRPLAATTPAAACLPGYVWRAARPNDFVCVTHESRARVAEENRTAAARIQPGGGAYGPNTCRSGFVWREAFDGDVVCVTPQIRALVRQENQLGPSRRTQKSPGTHSRPSR
jgi:hypothetical protein